MTRRSLLIIIWSLVGAVLLQLVFTPYIFMIMIGIVLGGEVAILAYKDKRGKPKPRPVSDERLYGVRTKRKTQPR